MLRCTERWPQEKQMPQFEGLPQYGNYIDGRLVAPVGGKYLPTENPYTGEVWAHIARGNAEDVDHAVTAADRALRRGPWSGLTPSERGRMPWRFGTIIAANAELPSEVVRREHGKLADAVHAAV